MDNNSCKMTFSSLVPDKSGKRIVRVLIEREGLGGTDRAEGTVPGGRIDSFRGFSPDEVTALSDYLKDNETEILARAKAISNPMRWMS